MTDPTDSPTSGRIAALESANAILSADVQKFMISMIEARDERDALESANAALRAELEAANKKAALADEIGRTIRESMRRGDLDDWLARYDALERESGGQA